MKKVCLFIFSVLIFGFQSSKAQESNVVQWGSIKPTIDQNVTQVVTDEISAMYLLEDSTITISGVLCSTENIQLLEALKKVVFISNYCAVTNDNVAHLIFWSLEEKMVEVPQVLKSYQVGNRFLLMKTDSSVYYINENKFETLLEDENVRDISVSNNTGIIYFKDGSVKILSSFLTLPTSLNNNIQSIAFTAFNQDVLILKQDGSLIYFTDNEYLIPISNITQIQGGLDHFFFITDTGDLYEMFSSDLFFKKDEMEDVSQISFYEGVLIGIKNGGEVFGLGSSVNYGEINYDFTPNISDLIELDQGNSHSIGIKKDSSVIVWGKGIGAGELEVPLEVKVLAVGVMRGLSIAIKKDKSVIAWGDTAGEFFSNYAELLTLNNAETIKVADANFVILLSDGKVWASNVGFLDHLPPLRDFTFTVDNNFFGLTKNGEVVSGTLYGDSFSILSDLSSIIDITPEYALKSNGKIISTYGEQLSPEIARLRNVVSLDYSYNNLVCLFEDGSVKALVFDTFKSACVVNPSEKGFAKVKSFYPFVFYGFKKGNERALLDKRLIKGSVFKDDLIENCQYDEGEAAYANAIIKVLPDNYYASTDSLGYYDIPVTYNEESYLLERIVNAKKAENGEVNCVDAYEIALPQGTEDFCCIDFNVLQFDCPELEVEVSASRKRRCFNSSTAIKYGNSADVSSGFVSLTVTYPEHLVPKQSTPTWTSKVGNVLTYEFSSITPNEQKTIIIQDSVSCGDESIRGLTECISAIIKETNECGKPPLSEWDQVELELTKKCEDGVVNYKVANNTTFDMSDSTAIQISINDTLVRKSRVKLKAFTDTQIDVNAFGDLISIEVGQTIGFPEDSILTDFVEGCIASTQTLDDVVKGLALNKPFVPQTSKETKSCFTITGSYDPNDKQAVPVGLTDAHYVLAGTSIDYTIRFQNTGTDTAFKVVLVDTLDSSLDISTFMQGASSHPYSLEVSGKGNPILTFTFNNIYLPDSNVNVLASNGFVSFSISAFSNLADETIIENEAAIYFDYNSPVITNTVYHTIGEPKWEDFSRGYLVTIGDPKPLETANSISVKKSMMYPNPTTGIIYLQEAHEDDDFEIHSVLGEVVYRKKVTGKTSFSVQELPKGIYLYQIHRHGKVVDTGKLILE